MRSHPPLPMLALAAALATPIAFAQTTEPPPPVGTPPATHRGTAPKAMSFTDLDANADGKVSRDEAMLDADLTRHFAKVDRDADGELSQNEYARFDRDEPSH